MDGKGWAIGCTGELNLRRTNLEPGGWFGTKGGENSRRLKEMEIERGGGLWEKIRRSVNHRRNFFIITSELTNALSPTITRGECFYSSTGRLAAVGYLQHT